LLVDPSKIAIIVDFLPPTSVKQLHTMLGHIGYYKNFIKGYAQMTTPMENFVEEGLSVRLDKRMPTDLRHTETEDCHCSPF
jgi:hypothetical protein